jgi:LPS-assembly protein
LEPRLYYLYSPYRDQSDFPLFDSAEAGLYFDSLFRRNRFVGADRQGDANQLTAALTSRILSASSGQEWLRASVGQILYFEDREVQLETTTPAEDQQYSSFAGEIAAQLSREWETRTYMQWDPEVGDAEKLAAELRYRGDDKQILNLAYRYEEDLQRQVDASVLWPVNSSINLVDGIILLRTKWSWIVLLVLNTTVVVGPCG